MEERNEPQQKGGSVTLQAEEQQLISPRGSKSSDAVEGLTPASVGVSQFASRVARTQLETGAVLLVLRNSATPTVSITGSLRAGSHFEPRDQPGLALITAEMLERGTKRRSKLEIASRLEGVGAEINFAAGLFTVSIGARSLAKDLPLVIETLAEELHEPAFPPDELEKLKQQTIASIQEQQANTRHRAYERFTQLIFEPSNPFYTPSGEQFTASINRITIEDVKEFYARQYGGRTLILSIVGDCHPDEVGKQFEKAFGTFAGPSSFDVKVSDPPPQAEQRREIVVLKDKANIDVLLGAFAPLVRRASDYYAALIANSALGQSTLSSRLGLQVRDLEGLTYGIGSRFRAPSLAAGPWYIAVSVNPQNVEKVISSATNVLRDYVQNGIRPDELADEKSSAIGSFKVSLATNMGIAESLSNAEFYQLGGDFIDLYPQLIQAVKREEVDEAIRKYFRPDHLTIVIAGDYRGV